MYQQLQNNLTGIIKDKQQHLLACGNVGLEKESLRVDSGGKISQNPHPARLGSALTNPYITTDYSEALLEFITPPQQGVSAALEFLKKIHQFVFGGTNIENQALAAITTKNIAWVRDHKASIYNLGGWSRRAVLNAARVLPSDERKHWLKLIIRNSQVLLDRWVAKWVLETT